MSGFECPIWLALMDVSAIWCELCSGGISESDGGGHVRIYKVKELEREVFSFGLRISKKMMLWTFSFPAGKGNFKRMNHKGLIQLFQKV